MMVSDVVPSRDWYAYGIALAEVNAGFLEPCPCWTGKAKSVFLWLNVVHNLWDDC
jgi:hypothetical protein